MGEKELLITPFFKREDCKKTHSLLYCNVRNGRTSVVPAPIHYPKGRGSVKKRTPLYLAILGAFVLIFVEIARYSYLNRELMRQENVSHLQSSYAQLARTFALFAERNWKLLDEWDSDMPNQLYDLTLEEAWSIAKDKAARWQYNDLYMFNQNGEYSSLSGRRGISKNKNSAFMGIYDENQPNLAAYISPDGARTVVFSKPIHAPVLMEGTTYTGLAVSYRNDELERTISVSLYDGASDCYMVKSDGTVVLSLESQTEFDDLKDNILDFVDGAMAVSRSEKDEMRADIAEGQSGSFVGRLNGEEYYIVYQPAGMEDWSIVGVVRASVVEAGARKMQADTISLATLIASLTMLVVSWLILGNMKAEAEYRRMEQQTLAQQKELSDRLFTGMGRIADRYAVCDLVRDRYEYHENVLSKPLYPETGGLPRSDRDDEPPVSGARQGGGDEGRPDPRPGLSAPRAAQGDGYPQIRRLHPGEKRLCAAEHHSHRV